MKKGKTTYGSYGDIAAVDPIGDPLLKMFTIELKRGSSYSHPGDLLDFKTVNGAHPWVRCLMQAIKSHKESGSKSWMMICKRDHRLPIVYLEARAFKRLFFCDSPNSSFVRFWLEIRQSEKGGSEEANFVGLPLEAFLEGVTPRQIIDQLNEA